MLENIQINKTSSTPSIVFDNELNTLKITGILVPENASSFFDPIFSWLTTYKQKPTEGLIFEFELEYFSSLSSILLLELMRRITKIENQYIVWTLVKEDADMLEIIDDYNDILNGAIKVNIIEEVY